MYMYVFLPMDFTTFAMQNSVVAMYRYVYCVATITQKY